MFEDRPAAELIDVMSAAARAESIAIAQRLAAVAALYAQRVSEYAERQLWLCDPMTAVAAEVSAAQNISRARAHGQVQTAVALAQRLPKVAAVFITGAIDYRMVSAIVARTDNVEDAVIAEVDEALAARVPGWMRLSKNKLRDRLDLWVAKFDAAGVRVPPLAEDHRYFDVEPHVPGTAFAGGVLSAADGAALDQRLDALAATVCPDDPRTAAQRRADACGALGRGEAALRCLCGGPGCAAAVVRESAATVAIHVLAEQATVDGTGDHPGYLSGFGVVPAESVRQAVAAGATIKPLLTPGGECEAGYRPSKGLADFVRWRDLTCRWPGCDAPVADCDLDHTVPWSFGATHASDLKAYCRTHHLVKTFYSGPNGWREAQRPDGTVVLTAPTGHTYVSEAHGATLFPALAQPTGEASAATAATAARMSSKPATRMPTRRRTRGQDRAARIQRERRRRLDINAELERQHQAWLAATYEPPPF
ncbi:MAG: HNH endonuclease signature motif containing protein [Mycobacterium sp.]|nr:HNH endonuclease signature motif containing protein [Mycobacterium sp.]